jgi:hypothetical protein
MDFRARSPKTTPKYPLHRGQIRAIFRAIKPLSYFSGKARRLVYPIYDNASRKRSALNMGPELPKNLTWQKLKEFPTNGFPGLWVSKYSAQTAKAPVSICRNDASKGFYRLLERFGMLRELHMNAEASMIIKVAPFGFQQLFTFDFVISSLVS